MVRLPKIKRRQKHQENVDRPTVVTGNFELQYEEVVKRNRFAIIGIIVTGLVAFAAFVPAAVYESTANSGGIIIEVEKGKITNPSQITVIKGDSSVGGGGYIEFR